MRPRCDHVRCPHTADHAGAARAGLPHDAVRVESLTALSRLRTDFHDCLTARADALFELTDAVLSGSLFGVHRSRVIKRDYLYAGGANARPDG